MIRLAGHQGRILIKGALTRHSGVKGPSPLGVTGAQSEPLARQISTTPTRSSEENEFRHSEDLAKERYDLRANEDIDRKRARLLYQSRKRGMLENGVILSSFADKYLDSFDADQLDQYDRLINLPTNDWDIFYWATKTKPTPPEFETAVMHKLRSHLNKKVSMNAVSENNTRQTEANDSDENKNKNSMGSQHSRSFLDGKRPDDVVFPAVERHYELNIKPNEVDLVNYPQKLFDNRTTTLRGNNYMQNMTQWRKEFFKKRLKRVISSPVSIRNLSDDAESPVYSHKLRDKSVASARLEQSDLVDTEVERSLKHHNFVQYLLTNEFTDRLDEYEWEAEAWSNVMWHRNYGKSDVTIAPSKVKCTSCQKQFHCCDPGLGGYVPKELFANLTSIDEQQYPNELTCQRCQFEHKYQTNLDVGLHETEHYEMAKKLKDMKPSVICLVVDLTDLPNSLIEGLIDSTGTRHKLIIVGNKLDLLPIDGQNIVGRVTNCLRANLAKLRRQDRNLHMSDMVVLSARTGFGVESLVTKLLAFTENPRDIYLMGCANSGKSTLFNALLQSDLSAVRDTDLLSRVSREENLLGTGKCLLKFPVSRPDGWEIELKKNRHERVLRNTAVLERSLKNTTNVRQATAPHMSMLIDRMEYPALETAEIEEDSSALIDSASSSSIVRRGHQQPTNVVNFSDDHPFRKIQQRDMLSATKENFPNNPFLYQTPSLVNKRDQLYDLLTNDERLEVFPHETIAVRQYTLRPLQSIFIAGLARLDLLTATSYVTVTMFASKYLPIHVISTTKADQFYDTFLGSPYLGVPFGDSERLRAWPKLATTGNDDGYNISRASDIVLSSAGWALIEFGPDQECIVRGLTPAGRGISLRWPPLLAHGFKLDRGKKIRDTPLFRHPNFSIQRMAISANRH